MNLSTPKASYLSMSIYSQRSLSIYVYLLTELSISPCLSTPGDPSLSMSIYSQSFLSLHVYLLPEIHLSLSMPIYSQSFISLHVYLLPEIHLFLSYLLRSPFISFPRASSLSIFIYSALSIFVTFPSSCVQHSPLDVTERICLGVADSWVTSPLPIILTGVSCSIISPGRDKHF